MLRRSACTGETRLQILGEAWGTASLSTARQNSDNRPARWPIVANSLPPMDNNKRKPGGNWWYLLLLVQFVGTLWIPFYNSVEPMWAGIPFFYWYQMLMVFIGAGITAIVYFATE